MGIFGAFIGILVLLSTALSAEDASSGNLKEDLTCTKLTAHGTDVQCRNNGKTDQSCSVSEAEPGTEADYHCDGKNGEKFSGVLTCKFGVWQSILHLGNSSLCNLGGQILNIVYPDFLRMTGILKFAIPEFQHHKNAELTEEENLSLEFHNFLRSKHQAPPLIIDPKLNEAADKVVRKLGKNFTLDLDENANILKNLKKVLTGVSNMETNIYRQHPGNSNTTDLISQAIMAWYTVGSKSYNWKKISENLPSTTSMIFSRMVWKSTTSMGISTGHFANTSYVVCVYTPGRNVVTTDILSDFKANVIPALPK